MRVVRRCRMKTEEKNRIWSNLQREKEKKNGKHRRDDPGCMSSKISIPGKRPKEKLLTSKAL